MSKGCDQSSGQHRTDAGSFIDPHAHLVGSVPGPDQPVELQDLLLDPAQLSSECQETRTGHFRNSLVVWIGDDIEQLLTTSEFRKWPVRVSWHSELNCAGSR